MKGVIGAQPLSSQSPSSDTGFDVVKEEIDGATVYNFKFRAKFDIAEFKEFLALLLRIMETLYASGDRYFLIVDTTGTKNVSLAIKANSVSLLVQMMKEKQELFSKTLIASSVVVSSRVVAEIINTAFKVRKPSRPNHNVTTVEAAREYFRKLPKT